MAGPSRRIALALALAALGSLAATPLRAQVAVPRPAGDAPPGLLLEILDVLRGRVAEAGLHQPPAAAVDDAFGMIGAGAEDGALIDAGRALGVATVIAARVTGEQGRVGLRLRALRVHDGTVEERAEVVAAASAVARLAELLGEVLPRDLGPALRPDPEPEPPAPVAPPPAPSVPVFVPVVPVAPPPPRVLASPSRASRFLQEQERSAAVVFGPGLGIHAAALGAMSLLLMDKLYDARFDPEDRQLTVWAAWLASAGLATVAVGWVLARGPALRWLVVGLGTLLGELAAYGFAAWYLKSDEPDPTAGCFALGLGPLLLGPSAGAVAFHLIRRKRSSVGYGPPRFAVIPGAAPGGAAWGLTAGALTF
jgi:hypothetical protein